jgi:hypothetical protein
MYNIVESLLLNLQQVLKYYRKPAVRSLRIFAFAMVATSSDLILKAESEAQIRANARILQERIDAEDERIERDSQRIYSQRTGNSTSSNKSWSEKFAEQFVGLLCCFVIPVLVVLLPSVDGPKNEDKNKDYAQERFIALMNKPQQTKKVKKNVNIKKRNRMGGKSG